MSVSIGQKLLIAIGKSLTGRYIVYLAQLISMMVIARIYSPDQLGVFAIIQIFSVFFLLFSEMGLAPALINRKVVTEKERNGIFTVTLFVGLALFSIFTLLIPVIAHFYQRDDLLYLFLPVALSVIFSALTIVPLAALQKDQRFITIAKCDVTAEVFSLLIVVFGSYYLNLLIAIALKPLVIAIVRFLMSWHFSKTTYIGKAWFGKNYSAVKPLLSFSSYQLGFNLLNYFSRNLDNILVGKYFSMQSLGVYDQAYRIMKYPLLLFTFAISPAIQPVLTQIKDDKSRFESLHHRFIKYFSLIGTLLGVSVYFLAPLIVDIILGGNWHSVIPILKILALSIPAQVVLGTSGGFFLAAGRADLLFKCGVFSSATAVIAILFGIYSHDLITLCWALLISYSINFIQCYLVMARHIFPKGFIFFVKSILPSIVLNCTFIFYVINN